MWVAEFRLQDPKDIYTPLCENHDVAFYLVPHTHYVEDEEIHLIVGGTLSGTATDKEGFVTGLETDDRVASVERSDDFILVHAVHPASREKEAEITDFYDPRYVLIQPVLNAPDGWEYWKVGCHDRAKLNEIVQLAVKRYEGEIQSMQEETISAITSLAMTPDLTARQERAVSLAREHGYYSYPRETTVHDLADRTDTAYATFQEHLRKAESKIIQDFLRYRL